MGQIQGTQTPVMCVLQLPITEKAVPQLPVQCSMVDDIGVKISLEIRVYVTPLQESMLVGILSVADLERTSDTSFFSTTSAHARPG
jgi:hypothetical protein